MTEPKQGLTMLDRLIVGLFFLSFTVLLGSLIAGVLGLLGAFR